MDSTATKLFLMGMPNGGELMLLLIIVFVLFGGKKIPELAKGLGKGIRDFNDAKEGIAQELQKEVKKSSE